MVDDDAPCTMAPNAPKCPYLHWMVVNIPGKGRERETQTNHTLYSGGNLQAGNLGNQVPKTYEGPSPPAGPPHKYNFVVYDQKGNSLPANQPPPSPPSTGFDRRSWSSTNNLEQTATNFFLERA